MDFESPHLKNCKRDKCGYHEDHLLASKYCPIGWKHWADKYMFNTGLVFYSLVTHKIANAGQNRLHEVIALSVFYTAEIGSLLEFFGH